MKKIIVMFVSLVLISITLYAKDNYIHFDTQNLTEDEIATVGIDKSGEDINVIRIDNVFHDEMQNLGYRSTSCDDFIASFYWRRSLKISAKEHLLEISCLDEKRFFTTKINLEPKKSYLIKYKKQILTLTDEDGNETVLETTDAERYQEPEEGAPYCTLFSTKKIMKKEGSFSIYRIDNKCGEYRKHIPYFPVILHLTPYSLKLTPGEHTLKFRISFNGMHSLSIMTMTFNFEENKKYKICLVNPKETKKTGKAEVQIVAVEEN